MSPGRRPRAAAKIASRVEEKGLLEFLAALRDDPRLLVPEVRGGGLRMWRMRRLGAKLRRVHGARGKPGRLNRLARGKTIAAAYAAALLLVHQGKAPRLAMAQLPWGEVKYAIRGAVPKEFHLAVQHAHDPRLRALGYDRAARKSGVLVYCLPERTLAQPRGDPAPAEFVEEVLAAAPVEWQGEGLAWRCPHVHEEGPADGRLRPWSAELRFAGLSLRACRACLAALDEPLTATVVRRVGGVDARRDVALQVQGNPWTCQHDCPRCGMGAARDRAAPPAASAALAAAGPEAALMDRVEKGMRDHLQGADQLHLLAEERCFGVGVEPFLAALQPPPAERERGLLADLLARKPRALLLDDATLNKALLAYWQEERARILMEVLGDEAQAEELLRKHRDAPPAAVLDEAHRLAASKRALERLPRYRSLPRPVAQLDAWARAFKARGRDEAVKMAQAAKSRETSPVNPLVYAFLLATRSQEGKAWQYEATEVEFAGALAPAVEALLAAEGEAYHEALSRVAREAGLAAGLERA